MTDEINTPIKNCRIVRCGGCNELFGVVEWEITTRCPYCGCGAMAAGTEYYEFNEQDTA